MLTTAEPTKDLGSIKFGKPHKFMFTVKNNSPYQEEIENLSVGCGSCTTAETTKTVLEPNEESSIKVVFTPGKTGKQKKHVSVYAKRAAVLTLEFTADVYA